jgi:hypothetical protein
MDTVAVMPGVVTYGHHTMQLVGAVRCLKATVCAPGCLAPKPDRGL